MKGRCVIKKVWYDFGEPIKVMLSIIALSCLITFGVYYEQEVTHTYYTTACFVLACIIALGYMIIPGTIRYIKELKEWCAD